jgi:hypothetical protein
MQMFMQCPLVLPGVDRICNVSPNFTKTSQCQIKKKSSHSRIVACGHGQKDMLELAGRPVFWHIFVVGEPGSEKTQFEPHVDSVVGFLYR